MLEVGVCCSTEMIFLSRVTKDSLLRPQTVLGIQMSRSLSHWLHFFSITATAVCIRTVAVVRAICLGPVKAAQIALVDILVPRVRNVCIYIYMRYDTFVSSCFACNIYQSHPKCELCLQTNVDKYKEIYTACSIIPSFIVQNLK